MNVIAVLLGLFLVVAGICHFVFPTYFHSLVPTWMPYRGTLVFASGLTEIAVGSAILATSTRTVGAWIAAALIITYLVSHLDAARHTDTGDLLRRPWMIVARLVVNSLYIAWAVAVALTA